MKQPAFSIKNSELRTTLQETTSIVKSIFETANYLGTRSRFFELKSTERGQSSQPPKRDKNQTQEKIPPTIPQNQHSATQGSEHCQ